MMNTLGIECLMQAMANHAEAVADEREARSRYTGYSWGYHGREYIQRVEDAAAEVEKRLNEYIDARVDARLAESVVHPATNTQKSDAEVAERVAKLLQDNRDLF